MPCCLATNHYQLPDTNSKVKRGFTLIELLVVIALIGILASFAIASLSSAQAKGRDSRRKNDLDAIKKALYLFYTDNNQYPPLDGTGWCSRISSTTVPQVKQALEGGNYIKTVPYDPKLSNQAGDYLYYRSGPNTFELYSILENTNDPANTGPYNKSTCVDGYSSYNYLITQP